MNKISKKLFRYFLVVVLVFSILILAGFYWIFKYQMIEHHAAEMKAKVYSVKEQFEASFNDNGEQKTCVCLKYLDDITLAQVYFVRANGEPFVCKMCGECKNNVPDMVENFGKEVMDSKEYIQTETKNGEKTNIICAGIPVKERNGVTSAVVIVEDIKFQKDNFLMPLLVLAACLIPAVIISAFLAVILVNAL